MGFRAIATGGVLVGLLAISLAAQQKPPVPPRQPAAQKPMARFQARVDLVTLDVSVLDRDRQPVRGLTASDFTIVEDGKPLPVQTYSEIDIPEAAEATAPWVHNVAPDVRRNDDLADRRIIVLLLDDASPMANENVPRVKELARQVIEHLGPRDLAAVVFTLEKRNGQDFTDDHRRLLGAAERFMGQSTSIGAGMASVMYQGVADTLKMLSVYLGELPNRRKALFFASVGIPIDVTEMGPRTDLSPASDPTGMSRRLLPYVEETLAAAQRANVNIYALDPRGLQVATDGGYLLQGDFLRGISNDTGGFAVTDVNDPTPGIVQVFRENGSYYLLGYQPENPRAQGRFRKIEVRVNRPGVTVRARNGYYEPETEKPKPPRAPPSPLWSAVAALLPKGDVAMQVVAMPFANPGRSENAVAIVAGLRQPAPAGTERVTENVRLLVTAYNPSGDRKASTARDVRVTLRPERAAEVGYEVIARLDLKPGRYELRLAAHSSLRGKAGSVYCDIDVPNFSKSGIAMSGVAVSATSGPAAAPRDALAGLIPVVPTSVRDFAASDRVTAFVRVYQGGSGALATVPVHARIVDGRGATVFETTATLGADRFAAARAADYRIEVPLTQLRPGLHLLTITAGEGKRIASREVRFTVR